jgi:hypothetical protein
MHIVLCCGMIRSGSTVVYQAASAILEMRGLGRRCGYYEPPNPMPELLADGWSVLKVPYCGDKEKQLLRTGGAIGLYSYRDAGQSLASAFRAFRVAPGDRWIWRVLTEGAALDLGYFAAPDFHRIPFTDICDHLRDVICRIAGWLPGRELNSAEIDSLARDLSLENQKARPKTHPFDSTTLLFPQHFD